MRGRTILIAGLLTAAYAGQASAQTITSSPHDLSTGGVELDQNEICVYCHTPHGANPNTGGEGAPLWNKNYTAGPFTTYDTSVSSTLDAAEVLAVGSVSIACLSCHDGTQAMDAVINAPGTGFGDGLGPGGQTLINSTIDTITGAANLSADLSNDHPIGIEYAGGVDGTGALTDPDFAAVQTMTDMTNGPWFVDATGGSAGVRDKTDMILYTRTFAAGVGPSVECASCHDPHNGNAADGKGAAGNTDGSVVSFMRLADNSQSQVCLTCHVK
ncbi:MAG: hypothetical protein ACE5EU_06160 [Paracoccaceae bacterium]